MKKFGIVTLMGAPNAGKSTLLNAILGEKLSIVCHKSQTTRTRVAGILTEDQTQVLIVDTPGIFFNAKKKLEKAMVSAAWQATFEAHLIFLIVDVCAPYLFDDVEKIMEKLGDVSKKVVLILNKTDLKKDKTKLLLLTEKLTKNFDFQHIFMISAKTGQGVQDLVSLMKDKMPEADWMYPEDQLTNLSERFLTAELTREVLMHELHEEIPYGLAIQTEKWEMFDNGSVKIYQMICLEKKSHKPIVLGKDGQKIKKMGVRARQEIKKALGCEVHLKLYVKVDEKWQDKPDFYQELGLDPV